jgi:BirA family biotin operon repressor/biotin-[acetyl-CoA-carboxylase] ligase
VLTDDDLRAVLGAIGVVAPVRALEVTASTNATALAMADEGAPDWTLVTAAHQTGGRGRHGRSWHDVAERALLASVVLRPALAPATAGLLSLLAGAALADAIARVAGVDVRCKWPNDLLVGDAKVGGILGESRVDAGSLRAVVVGVGVNLTPPDVPGAGGIGEVGLADLLGAFIVGFHRGTSAADLAAEVRTRWIPVSSTIGREVRASGTDGSAIHGLATGIDDRGGLVVVTDDGERSVVAGEIDHLR